MIIDILFLAWNRLEFTRLSVMALLVSTDWTAVRSLWLYDDGSTDGTLELLQRVKAPCETHLVQSCLRSPVAIMNWFITEVKPEVFAKIDNDTMLPLFWLEECTAAMVRHPHVDLLGIEPMYECQPGQVERECVRASHIGGIGLMRGRVFDTLPVPNKVFGFTGWQKQRPEVIKAWLRPALPVVLLNKLPIEPWHSLSVKYRAMGWQRPWETYTENDRQLWAGVEEESCRNSQ